MYLRSKELFEIELLWYLRCLLMLNWIAWNRPVSTFKLRIYAKLNCLRWNCFCMLNWSLEIDLFLTLKLYLRSTELFKIELFICIKMDLALNNLQSLLCHKIQTNQTKLSSEFFLHGRIWVFLIHGLFFQPRVVVAKPY